MVALFKSGKTLFTLNTPLTQCLKSSLFLVIDFFWCDCFLICCSQSCEVLVPIALADMHECERKKEVKRFRGVCEKPAVLKRGSGDHQVRSPFRFFM